MTAHAATLDALRERIRVLEGGPRIQRRRLSTGIGELDELVGGLPSPGILEVSGRAGTGRTCLVLRLVAERTRQHRMVAWVDATRSLYPPAAAELGVELSRLLLVRPPEDGSNPEIWATEQLLRSGCFDLVVTSMPTRRRARKLAGGHAWARAAEHGHCTAVVISERPVRHVPADVRLCVGDGKVAVLRDRSGRHGRSVVLSDRRHA